MTHDVAYYRKIQGHYGATSAKDAEIRILKSEIARDFGNSLDCETAQVNGTSQTLMITKQQDQNVKAIVSRPDETFYLGDLVTWLGTSWIVDSIDADNRIVTRGKMRRCNGILRWRDESGTIHAYPAYIEDATKYSEGWEGRGMIRIGEFQIKAKIHMDKNSIKIMRDKRFLLDATSYIQDLEQDDLHPTAFAVSRRNAVTGTQNGHGYVELTMTECAYSELDNPDLMLADYYKPNEAYAIAVTNASDSLLVAVGAEYALTVTATLNDAPIAAENVTFVSSDTSIATVEADGTITGVNEGSVTITIKAGTAEVNLSVGIVETVPTFVIYLSPDDGSYEIPYGTSKDVGTLIYNEDDELPYELVSEIIGDAGLASVTKLSDKRVRITVAPDSKNIGKEFTLRVKEVGWDVTKDAVFKIVGWF